VAVRDPNGFRPLVLGDLSGQPVIASESCAFDLLGARLVRELKPGEVLEISGKGEMRSSFPLEKTEPTPCIFEYIYLRGQIQTFLVKMYIQYAKN
jgi:amidophosphoribosyltransferase